MTSYEISQGYAPDAQSELREGELLGIAKEAITVWSMKDTLRRYGIAPALAQREAEHFKTLPTQDLRLRVTDNGSLYMAASSMAGRDVREAACRAVVTLVLDEAYTRGRSVQVTIT